MKTTNYKSSVVYLVQEAYLWYDGQKSIYIMLELKTRCSYIRGRDDVNYSPYSDYTFLWKEPLITTNSGPRDCNKQWYAGARDSHTHVLWGICSWHMSHNHYAATNVPVSTIIKLICILWRDNGWQDTSHYLHIILRLQRNQQLL